MSRTYYTEYVRHALRFYSRNCLQKPVFKSDADKENWLSCYTVIKTYPVETQALLLEIYSGFDTLPDEVYNACKKYDINQNIVWDLMKEVERKISKRRGLM